MSNIDELKKALKEKEFVFGTKQTLKNLKNGKTKKVFLANNCPENVKTEIKSYNAEVIELKELNLEIAVICKRPHPISVLSY